MSYLLYAMDTNTSFYPTNTLLSFLLHFLHTQIIGFSAVSYLLYAMDTNALTGALLGLAGAWIGECVHFSVYVFVLIVLMDLNKRAMAGKRMDW